MTVLFRLHTMLALMLTILKTHLFPSLLYLQSTHSFTSTVYVLRSAIEYILYSTAEYVPRILSYLQYGPPYIHHPTSNSAIPKG
jgi:hypothetical protein